MHWDSETLSKLFANLASGIGSTAMYAVLPGLIIGKLGIPLFAKGAIYTFFRSGNNTHKVFHDARMKAKLTGKVLACALALRFPFKR